MTLSILLPLSLSPSLPLFSLFSLFSLLQSPFPPRLNPLDFRCLVGAGRHLYISFVFKDMPFWRRQYPGLKELRQHDWGVVIAVASGANLPRILIKITPKVATPAEDSFRNVSRTQDK